MLRYYFELWNANDLLSYSFDEIYRQSIAAADVVIYIVRKYAAATISTATTTAAETTAKTTAEAVATITWYGE